MKLGADNSTDPSTLIGKVRFLSNTQDNTNAFPASDIKGLLNEKYHSLIATLLDEIFGEWKPNVEIEETTLEADTQEYLFPSNILTIDRVEIDYQDSTDTTVVADRIKLSQIEEATSNYTFDDEIVCTENNPCFWLEDDTSLWIDPVSDETIPYGLRIHYTYEPTDLSGSDDEPVLKKAFHNLLCMDVVLDWGTVKRNVQLESLQARRDRMFQNMLDFYVNRDKDIGDESRITPASMSNRAI